MIPCKLFIVALSVFLFSCAKPLILSSKDNLMAFPKIELLALNSKKELVEESFGKPDRVESVYQSEDEEGWIYIDEKTTKDRAIFIINKDTGLLISKAWWFLEEDPEKNIQEILKRFPQARFKEEKQKWLNSHAASDEIVYKDDARGLMISARRKRNEVVVVSWSAPNQK